MLSDANMNIVLAKRRQSSSKQEAWLLSGEIAAKGDWRSTYRESEQEEPVKEKRMINVIFVTSFNTSTLEKVDVNKSNSSRGIQRSYLRTGKPHLRHAISKSQRSQTRHLELKQSAVFSSTEIHKKLVEFKSSLPDEVHKCAVDVQTYAYMSEGCVRSKLYFVKVDVKACFDTIEQGKLLSILKEIITEVGCSHLPHRMYVT